ncbi:MAG: DUF5678 domain-containing protein [Chloroflexi bacterium]|nr:DUF5678 domain-containing protein [Chloroflexota bacterium]
MEAITLREDLRETLERDAEREARSVDDLVNEAVERFLDGRQLRKLDAEIAAYEKMHTQLRRQFLGQWVAVHEQQLVDHDSDVSALYRRVRARYGRTSVLIRRVTERPAEEIRVRTPSTGAPAP